jgi:hypothetical protein
VTGQAATHARSGRRAPAPAAATWRRGLVLDLETAPDPVAAARVRDGSGPRAVIERVALHRLDAVATLAFEIGPDLAVRGVSLASHSTAGTSEDAMLIGVADAARSVARDGGLIATFAGSAHDLPFLRHRLLVTGRTDRVRDVAAPEHLDVMVEWAGPGRYPRLADLCAALDLPVWTAGRGRGGVEEREAKSRLDVCATFVLLLTLRAGDLGLGRRAVEDGWRAMSEAVLAAGVTDPNLLGLLRHPSIVRVR